MNALFLIFVFVIVYVQDMLERVNETSEISNLFVYILSKNRILCLRFYIFVAEINVHNCTHKAMVIGITP